MFNLIVVLPVRMYGPYNLSNSGEAGKETFRAKNILGIIKFYSNVYIYSEMNFITSIFTTQSKSQIMIFFNDYTFQFNMLFQKIRLVLRILFTSS